MIEYEYGVFYEGRGLGWVGIGSLVEARWDLYEADEKYLPGRVGRRKLGPVEYEIDAAGTTVLDGPLTRSLGD